MSEYVVLRKEEYEQLVRALERAVELAERFARIAKRKRGGGR